MEQIIYYLRRSLLVYKLIENNSKMLYSVLKLKFTLCDSKFGKTQILLNILLITIIICNFIGVQSQKF